MSTKRRESAKGRKAEDGTVLCSCGCGQKPVPPRRSWFSDACVEAWKIRNDPGHVRRLLQERDKGICAACGCDADAEFGKIVDIFCQGSRLFNWLKDREENDFHERTKQRRTSDSWRELYPECIEGPKTHQFNFEKKGRIERAEIMRLSGLTGTPWILTRESGWDADHIVEVVNGGGQCGLENYQCLCHPCHKAKTKRLAAELAQRRRKPSPQPELVLA